MTFEQLNCFIAIVEHNTFFDAAESLHMGQSNLSKQIIKMEKELGISLLDRSRRNAALTPAGEEFYRDALSLTCQYSQALSGLQKYREDFQKEVHVGTLPILNQYHLTQYFKAFSESHKDISVTLEEVEEQELLHGLDTDRFDLIIARKTMLDSKLHALYPLTEDNLVAVVPAGHRLAVRPSLTLEDIAEEPFLLMNRYTSIYQLCMDMFRQSGIQPHILRTARVESLLSAVAIGEGISLLAESNFNVFHHDHVTAVPLNPPVTLPVVLGRKKNRNITLAMKELISFLV